MKKKNKIEKILMQILNKNKMNSNYKIIKVKKKKVNNLLKTFIHQKIILQPKINKNSKIFLKIIKHKNNNKKIRTMKQLNKMN